MLWFKRAQSGKGTGRGTGQAGTGAGPGQAGVGASSNHDLTPQAAVLTPLAAYWLLLRRAPEAGDVEHAQHTLRDQGQTTLLEALTSSTEFRLRYREWQSGREEDWHAGPFHDALARLGDNRTYVNLCYRVLFDREADAEGLAFYVQRLQENASRLSVLQTFVRSSRAPQPTPGTNGSGCFGTSLSPSSCESRRNTRILEPK